MNGTPWADIRSRAFKTTHAGDDGFGHNGRVIEGYADPESLDVIGFD